MVWIRSYSGKLKSCRFVSKIVLRYLHVRPLQTVLSLERRHARPYSASYMPKTMCNDLKYRKTC